VSVAVPTRQESFRLRRPPLSRVATLLFLGASVSQLPAIRYARACGHRIVVVDGDPHAVAFAEAHVSEAVDFADVERVSAIADRSGVEGVLAISSDRAVMPAAAIAERLGLPGIGVDVARAMTDKACMRDRLAAAGVPQPRHAVVRTAADLTTAELRWPAVLKPIDSGGQRGVFLVHDAEEAALRLDETLAFSRSGSAMLEEFMDGIELNGILVVRDGEPTLVTLSDRLRPPGIAFGVGWIHSFPSSLPDASLAAARAVSFDAVRALGLRDGIAFPQVIVAADGAARLVEIAARIPAGQMADLVRFATGIELYDVAFAQALGEEVPDALLEPEFTTPVAIRFFTASPGVLPLGTVESIAGLDDVRASPGVLAAGLYFGVGTAIGPLQVDADRRGYVVATAGTPTEALELADRASRKLVVKVSAPTAAAARS
jgi:biotin carboxylase